MFQLRCCHWAQIRTEPSDDIQTLQFAGFLGPRTGHRYNKQKICEHCCGLALFSHAVYPQCVCAKARRRGKGLGNSPSCQQASFAGQDATWAEDKEKLHPFPFVLAPQLEALGKHGARPQRLTWLALCISPSMPVCGLMLLSCVSSFSQYKPITSAMLILGHLNQPFYVSRVFASTNRQVF